MIEQSVHNVLAIGVDVVRLAVSAKKAGYEVFAADYFGDQDLERVCLKGLSIIEQRPGATCGRMGTDFEAEPLLHFAKELADKNQIDGVLLSSGLDDSHSVLCELNDLIPILGNQPDVLGAPEAKCHSLKAHPVLSVVPRNGLGQCVSSQLCLRPEVAARYQDRGPDQGCLCHGTHCLVGMQADDEVIEGSHRRGKRFLPTGHAPEYPAAGIDDFALIVMPLVQDPREHALSTGHVGDVLDASPVTVIDEFGQDAEALRVAVKAVTSSARHLSLQGQPLP